MRPYAGFSGGLEREARIATRLLGAKLNLLSTREVLNAKDEEKSDGGGLLLRCSGPGASWVFWYTSATGKRREMGLGACVRHNAKAAGESLALARDLVAKQRALLASDPIDERDKADAARREAVHPGRMRARRSSDRSASWGRSRGHRSGGAIRRSSPPG
jgi:hypothetical protein